MKRIIVLVVDDQSKQQILISDYLERQGYNVICASNGEEAAACNKDSLIDFIITATHMNKGDGIGLLQEIQRMMFQPATLIHHTTLNYGRPNDGNNYRLSAWVQAYIPFATFIIRSSSDIDFLQEIMDWLTAEQHTQVA